MFREDEVLKKILSMKDFDEGELGVTFATHKIYVGTALTYIKNHFPHEMGRVSSSPYYSKYDSVILGQLHSAVVEKFATDEEIAEQRTSSSWRQLRRALSHLYSFMGMKKAAAEILAITNPIAVERRQHRPEVRERKKCETSENFALLYNDRNASKDRDSASILVIAAGLGLRPFEVPRIEIVAVDKEKKFIEIKIPGSKGTLSGTKENPSRGLDRTVRVTYSDLMVRAVSIWSQDTDPASLKRRINNARGRVRRAAIRLGLSDGKRFCFYTLRYQKGSELKFKYKDDENADKIIAAVLGHRGTKAAANYGHTGTGKGLKRLVCDVVPDAKDVSRVIDNKGEFVKQKTKASTTKRKAKIVSAKPDSKRGGVAELKQGARRDQGRGDSGNGPGGMD